MLTFSNIKTAQQYFHPQQENEIIGVKLDKKRHNSISWSYDYVLRKPKKCQ